MAKDPDNLAGSFETENTGGLLSGFLAEEEAFDRRSLWRLGSWGVASVGAVIVAILANQSAIGWRRAPPTMFMSSWVPASGWRRARASSRAIPCWN